MPSANQDHDFEDEIRRRADAYAGAREILSGANPSFTPESLRDADAVVENYRLVFALDAAREQLINCGCYVGEVIRRNLGGRWLKTATLPTAVGGGFIALFALELSDHHIGKIIWCDPIGRVLKRFLNGSEDGLPCFYEYCAEQARRRKPAPPCAH